MDLDRISVTVRERDGWEAIDLGFVMVARWWRAIYAAWVVVVLPPALLLNVALVDYPWVALLLLWWLKPLFDRVPLAIVSRAFFGETPTPWRIITRPRQYIGRGVLGALTLRRFSPWRSYLMPVDQLEELSATARGRRVVAFSEGHSGMAWFLTAVCMTFEQALFLGLYVLALLFFPEGTEPPALLGESAAWWAPYVVNAFYVAAMALIEPFYVAAGFSLYINRRVELEGWDIELGFRRMAARLRKLAGAVVVLALTLAAGTAQAEDETPDFATTIEQVLASPEFGTTKSVETWAPIDDDEPDESAEPLDLDLGFAGEIGRFLATVLVWTLGTLAVALLLYLIVAVLQRGAETDPDSPRRPDRRPDSLFGLDLTPGSLPHDLLGAARQLWARGDATGAMSLLYRGALAYVVDRLRVDVPDSATEGECISIVATHLGEPVSDDFETLTHAWQLIAYANRRPTTVTFEDLCQRWSHHLRKTA